MDRSYYRRRSVRYRTAMRRRLRKRRQIVRRSLLALIIVVVCVFLWRPNAKPEKTESESNATNTETVDTLPENEESIPDLQEAAKSSWAGISAEAGTFEKIKALAAEDERAEYVLKHPEKYPVAFLELLGRNSETLEFVLDYPEHHEDAPATEITGPLDEVPLIIQWDERWGYQNYGGSTIAVSGCAPTCMSMVATYFTKNRSFTPSVAANYADNANYYIAGSGTSWEFFNRGSKAFGVETSDLPLEQESINEALDSGELIICSMNPGDFTDVGHFIILSGYTDEGYIVRDPNSRIRSARKWSYAELAPQINNLWSCHKYVNPS